MLEYCWTEYANTNVNDGRRVSTANNVDDCQQACVDDPECTGVDWAPDKPQGQKCSKSGSWSGTRNDGTATGVTHYDLNRNCTAGSIYTTNWN